MINIYKLDKKYNINLLFIIIGLMIYYIYINGLTNIHNILLYISIYNNILIFIYIIIIGYLLKNIIFEFELKFNVIYNQ